MMSTTAITSNKAEGQMIGKVEEAGILQIHYCNPKLTGELPQ